MLKGVSSYSLEVSGSSVVYLLLCMCRDLRRERRRKVKQTRTCIHLVAHTHTHTSSTDLGSITEREHQQSSGFSVWRSACSLWASTNTQATNTHWLANKSVLKCHVATVTEHEGLAEIELSNSRLHWLVIVTNFPPRWLRKSAVSELADSPLPPTLLSGHVTACSILRLHAYTHVHKEASLTRLYRSIYL